MSKSIHYANVAQSGRFIARVRYELIALAQVKRDTPSNPEIPGERQVVHDVLLKQEGHQRMAWLLVTMTGAPAALDTAVTANPPVNGVYDYDRIGDGVSDAMIKLGVAAQWKYLGRTA